MRRIKYFVEFLLIFAINALMYWYFGSYFNLLLGIAMLVFLGVNIAMALLVLPKITAQIWIPASEFSKQTDFVVKIQVKNESILPVIRCHLLFSIGNAFWEEETKRDIVISLAPHGEECYEMSLCSELCGDIEIALHQLVVEDYLCFHQKKKSVQQVEHIYILPREERERAWEQNDYASGLTESTESSLRGSDFSEVGQIREYIPGDSLKDIHWKLSAKKEALMVKERLQMSSQKLQLILCLNKQSPDKADEVLCFLYELGNFVIQNRIPVTLYWWSGRSRELCQETADTKEHWRMVFEQVLYTKGGDEAAEAAFCQSAPGQDYLKVSEELLMQW